MRILCIGDPHFKADNEYETDLMTAQVITIITTSNIDMVVVMGDILHRHEKIDLYPFKRAVAFLRALREVATVYVLIGNHDRPNNSDFLTPNHAFGFLEDWANTIVVDTVKVHQDLVFVPYVPAGRFEEALSTVKLFPPYANIRIIFAHQEFKGAKMNAITSNLGDEWDVSYPLCISGHIHDYADLQRNLIYVGTPFQHSFGDTGRKTISMFELGDTITHRRIDLQIPRRIQVSVDVSEVMSYVVPPLTKVKLRVSGNPIEIKQALKLSGLLNHPDVKIVIIPYADNVIQEEEEVKAIDGVRPTLDQLIRAAVMQCHDPALEAEYTNLFQ